MPSATFIALPIVIALWVAPVIIAFRRNHERKGTILLLCLLMGPIGSLISFILLSSKDNQPVPGEDGVMLCRNCGSPYRLADYQVGATIICSSCRVEIQAEDEPIAEISEGQTLDVVSDFTSEELEDIPLDNTIVLVREDVTIKSLLDLYLNPSRFFQATNLDVSAYYISAAWLVGVSWAMDRIDTRLLQAELGRPRPGLEIFTESWVAYWSLVLGVGILWGMAAWLVGGWWYGVRLKWSGASGSDKDEVRQVFIFSTLVAAAPTILVAVVATVLFEDYLDYWMTDEAWSMLLLIFPFWSVLVSYKGVCNRFDVTESRARLWFVILPILYYLIALGVLTFVLAYFGYFEPSYPV